MWEEWGGLRGREREVDNLWVCQSIRTIFLEFKFIGKELRPGLTHKDVTPSYSTATEQPGKWREAIFFPGLTLSLC